MSATAIVKPHVDAMLAEAAAGSVSRDALARALIGQAIGIFKAERPLSDIAAELTFLIDNLDDDETYPFMRP